MHYEAKTDWKYDDIVTERDLNRIEQGVQDSQEKADEATTKAIKAEANAKAYTDQQIQLVTETGIPKLVTYPYVLTAIADDQTDFVIPLETFDKDTDTVMVIQNSTILSTDRFSIVNRTVRLVVGVKQGTEIFVQVFKNVPIGSEGAINGSVMAKNSVPSDRVQGLDEHFTDVSNPHNVTKSQIGLDNVENANITTIRTDSTKELRVEVVSSVGSQTPTLGRIVFVQDEGRAKVGNGSAWV